MSSTATARSSRCRSPRSDAFDPDLWERTARVAASEAAADGLAMTYAPMLDVARDPRWGRIAESPGEDPWVAARFARAKVRGFQGGDLAAADSLAATAKHLAAYGAVTAGREYAAVDVSERSLHEIYLPPFRAAVEAGVAAIMPAFHNLAGVPMSADAAVLRDLVRGRWGFDGVIVSDYGAIAELVVHGVAADLAEAAALALRAGIDIDLMGNAYARGLPGALERGRVTMADVDTAVRRILALKAALGLFDDPYRRGHGLTSQQLAPHRALAREAARRAIVLLTNRGDALPLAPDGGRIAVIGPLADARADMLGPWAAGARAEEMVTILEGVRAAFPAREVTHSPGVEIDGGDTSGIRAALDLARAAEVVVLCLGEARAMSGEAASRARPDLPGRQTELATAVLDLGKPVVVTLSSGRPLMAPWLFERADAVLATWFLGSEAGNAVGDVLCGTHNPTARLPVSWPVDIGQIPIFYAQRPTGRPADPAEHYTAKYIDLPVEPLFPFGHGLSYTRFAYRDLRARPDELRPGEAITVEVEVANEGAVAGEETIFLFLRDPVASVARPLLELKGRGEDRARAGRARHRPLRAVHRRPRLSRPRPFSLPRARRLRDPRRPECGQRRLAQDDRAPRCATVPPSMLDPLQPDWPAFAPLAELGPIERTAAGFRARTEAGPIEVSAFAPGILRLTLGELVRAGVRHSRGQARAAAGRRRWTRRRMASG